MQPTPPVPPSVPTVQGGTFPVPVPTDGAAPSAVLRAMEAQRSELRDQLERVQEQRDDLASSLKAEDITQPDREGLAARLKATDDRITGLEQQISQADLAVAKAAAVPGAVVEPPRLPESGPPEGVVAIFIVFTLFVLCPIAVAYARRVWKRGATVVAPVPHEVRDRLDQMGQAVESIAIEVERIGEGQRFLTRVMSDQSRQLGAGAAQPIQVPHGQTVADANHH